MPLDIYQQITDKIVAQIEADPGQWKMPWRASADAGELHMPRSAVGRHYRGVNVLVLWCAAMEKGYTSPVWATYKQWKTQGAQVRKGEKSELVVYYDTFTKKDEQGEDQTLKFAKAFFVFNAAQVDGYEAPKEPEFPTEAEALQHIKEVDDYFHNVGSDVQEGGSRAFYSPSSDFIAVPAHCDFHTHHDYYSTLAHEHIHWTGHTSRCDRELKTARFGNEAYAFEELIAELGAAFLCSSLGLENEPRIDHAQYINSWLRVLKGDKKAIFTAASASQKAVDFLDAFQPPEAP